MLYSATLLGNNNLESNSLILRTNNKAPACIHSCELCGMYSKIFFCHLSVTLFVTHWLDCQSSTERKQRLALVPKVCEYHVSAVDRCYLENDPLQVQSVFGI